MRRKVKFTLPELIETYVNHNGANRSMSQKRGINYWRQLRFGSIQRKGGDKGFNGIFLG